MGLTVAEYIYMLCFLLLTCLYSHLSECPLHSCASCFDYDGLLLWVNEGSELILVALVEIFGRGLA